MSSTLHRIRTLFALAAAVFAAAAAHAASKSQAPQVHIRTLESKPLTLDRLYRSMRGPTDEQVVTLADANPRRRVWITGIDVEPVDARGKIIADGQQFICHVNFSHPDRDAWAREMAARQTEGRSVPFNWFTLIQGHYSLDFPAGFAMPAYSDQGFRVLSMAQNQDPERKPFEMRIRSRIRYVYDDDLKKPMVPLSKFSWDIRVAKPYVPPEEKKAEHGEHCAAAEGEPPAPGQAESGDAVLHFAVPPGRHEYRATFDGSTKIPFDTTAHHLSAHLHAYGQSLELVDVTAGKSLFKSRATNNAAHTGITRMTHLSSVAGVPIYRGHRYELIAVYDNTSDHPIDAMAVVYVYYKDKAS